MHECCIQGWTIIEGSQVLLPLFCSFYFRTSKQGQILYRIIKGIFITFRPLSHFCSPSPTFCSHSPTFWLILSHFWLTLFHFMLILASWSRYPVWSLSPRPESHAWLSDWWRFIHFLLLHPQVHHRSGYLWPLEWDIFVFFTAYLIASWAS